MAPPAQNVGAIVRTYDDTGGWTYRERRYQESVDHVYNELHSIAICLSVGHAHMPAHTDLPKPILPRLLTYTSDPTRSVTHPHTPCWAPS